MAIKILEYKCFSCILLAATGQRSNRRLDHLRSKPRESVQSRREVFASATTPLEECASKIVRFESFLHGSEPAHPAELGLDVLSDYLAFFENASRIRQLPKADDRIERADTATALLLSDWLFQSHLGAIHFGLGGVVGRRQESPSSPIFRMMAIHSSWSSLRRTASFAVAVPSRFAS
jgi:hypothetical protein